MNLPQPKYQPFETKHINNGIQHLFRFENGFGASVASHDFTYGGVDHWELAVIKFKTNDKDSWDLVYYTPITDDVLGFLSWDSAEDALEKIINLKGDK